MRLRDIAYATLLVFVTTGCGATSGGPRRGWSITSWERDTTATPPAVPAVVIPAARNRVVDVLVDRMIQQGYSVGWIDDHHVQFERPARFTDWFLGFSTFRVTFLLLDTSAGLRVRAEMASVRTLDGGYEETVLVKGGRSAAEIQRTLETVKSIAGGREPAP